MEQGFRPPPLTCLNGKRCFSLKRHHSDDPVARQQDGGDETNPRVRRREVLVLHPSDRDLHVSDVEHGANPDQHEHHCERLEDEVPIVKKQDGQCRMEEGVGGGGHG